MREECQNNNINNITNVHQALDELDRDISNLTPALDKLAERIRQPKDDLENIIEGLKQISKKTPHSQRPSSNEHILTLILDLVVKSLSIITIASLILGFLVAYRYLGIIDKTAIFPEIISQHQSILGVLIFYLLNIYLLFVLFFIPNIRHILGSKSKKIQVFFVYIMVFIFYIALLFVFAFINIDIKLIPYLKYNDLFALLYFISILILCCMNLYFSLKDTKIEWINQALFFGVSIFFLIMLSLFNIKHIENSLHLPRFIEKPQDSSWYLIHNGNTTSENINGLSKRDILAQKDIFNAKDCTTLKNKDSKKKCQDDNKDIFNNRDNALYGYMAWNLGNTKVFCPVSVDFFDGKNNTEKSAKCLVIDGKYLQLISAEFLAQK